MRRRGHHSVTHGEARGEKTPCSCRANGLSPWPPTPPPARHRPGRPDATTAATGPAIHSQNEGGRA
eukprot:5380380-Alexandrium_andersonii.AAC.1